MPVGRNEVVEVGVLWEGGGVVGSETPGGQCQWSSWGVHCPGDVVVRVVVSVASSPVVVGRGSQCPRCISKPAEREAIMSQITYNDLHAASTTSLSVTAAASQSDKGP